MFVPGFTSDHVLAPTATKGTFYNTLLRWHATSMPLYNLLTDVHLLLVKMHNRTRAPLQMVLNFESEAAAVQNPLRQEWAIIFY